jgi:hypothetical protein
MNREKVLTVLRQEMRLGPGALSWHNAPAGDAHPVSRSQARDLDTPLLDPCMHPPIHPRPAAGCLIANCTRMHANGRDDSRSMNLQEGCKCVYVRQYSRQIITDRSEDRHRGVALYRANKARSKDL